MVGNPKEKDGSLSYVFTKGDFMIGGLSPVHFSPTEAEEQQNPNSFTCQGRLNTRGFEAVEAMLFTLDMLNEGPLKDVVLPNITLGMDIKDTCGSADYAVRESLKFSFISNAHVQDQCSGFQRKKEQQTIAVVGAAYSGVSMAVTNLCGLFYVPVVSYASTSILLSNKVRFRYFLRTVPNDMLQAQVMADLVRAMKWNYVITLASDTEYGRSGIEAFKRALANYRNNFDVCIPVDERFTKRSTDEHFESIFRQMKANPKARVVILFAQLRDADILLAKFRQQKYMATEGYVWIGSDAWADSKQILKGNERLLNKMFGVVPEVVHIKEFDKYFTNFNDKRRKRNPWMREYEYLKVAHDPAFHRHTFKHYPKAQYVMDAVLAAAYALHNMLGCEQYKDCTAKINRNVKVPDLLNYLQNVRFPGKSRDAFSFDKLGDAIGVYDIKHLKLVDANYEFVNVGKWGAKESGVRGINNGSLNSFLELDHDMVDEQLRNYSRDGVPFSTCSRECQTGYHKSPEKYHAKCCWWCRPCTGNSITNTSNMDDCIPCPRGYWTNKNHSHCDPIQPTSLHWSDTLGVIIICISGAGVLAVICTFVVYYIYRETPVVRASSRELCYVLLFGIAWCFLTPLVFLADRTDSICRAIPFVTGLCPSLIAGTLLTKTNRISRIFNQKLLKTGAPNCLSKKWQILMVICLAVAECLISGGCVIFSNTGSKLVIFDSKKEVLRQCKELPDICTAIWWVYNAVLALICTFQAFRTRKLPENYNEAKFISFTMVVTCIVVTIFIPTYIGTRGTYRTTITCFVFIIGGFSTLCCMFVPKLYIILWRPEKNVPMQPRNSSIRLGTISPSSSFVRRLSVTIEKPKDVRTNRIKSLPIIRLRKPSDNVENAQTAPQRRKTKRSLSLSPEMLQPRITDEIPGRHAHSTQFPISMEMIEEGQEREECNELLYETEEFAKTVDEIEAECSCVKDNANLCDESDENCDNDGLLSTDREDSFISDDSPLGNSSITTCASFKACFDEDKNCELNCDQVTVESTLLQTTFEELNITCSKCGTAFQLAQIRNEQFENALYQQLSKLKSADGLEKLELDANEGLITNTVKNVQCAQRMRKRKLGLCESNYTKPRSSCPRRSEEEMLNGYLDVNKNGVATRLRNPSYFESESPFTGEFVDDKK